MASIAHSVGSRCSQLSKPGQVQAPFLSGRPCTKLHRFGSPLHVLQTCWTASHRSRVKMAATNPGGGVLDRPAVAPGYDQKKSTIKQKPPMYRVMLHNDTFNRREYVVRVLMKVVDGLTIDDAVNVMQEAHQNGMACVIECAQEDAERYCEGLRGNGLMASIEPAGGGGNGKPSE